MARGRFALAFAALALLGTLLGHFVAQGWAGRTVATLRRHRQAYAFVAPALFAMLVLALSGRHP